MVKEEMREKEWERSERGLGEEGKIKANKDEND